ncbi:hypothetical protein [Pasteurella multocida]
MEFQFTQVLNAVTGKITYFFSNDGRLGLFALGDGQYGVYAETKTAMN